MRENFSDEISTDTEQAFSAEGEVSESEFIDFGDENADILRMAKIYKRFLSRKLKQVIAGKEKAKFINIMHLTVDCPNFSPNSTKISSPINFIDKLKKQYPEYNVSILLPITGLNSETTKPAKKLSYEINGMLFEACKISADFEFFGANKKHKCSLYKFIKTESNIPIYGIYSESFSYLNNIDKMFNFKNLSLFLRAARLILKNINNQNIMPDVLQVDRIPFFSGTEFETNFPSKTKVVQITDDFIKYENQKESPFWAFINLADKKSMKKISKDPYILKGIIALSNLNPLFLSKDFDGTIDLIIANYQNLENTSDKSIKEKQRIIFKYLDARIRKLFPNFVSKEDMQYYPIVSSLKKAYKISLLSKTYYNELLANKGMFPPKLNNYGSIVSPKICFIQPVPDIDSYSPESGSIIYHNFDADNFRIKRVRNKNSLLREFSETRLKTAFIDKKLFLNDNHKIYGYIDYFFDSPLLFADIDDDMFLEGGDILFDTIIKLFEQNKNIKVIISSKNGLKSEYAKTRIKFFDDSRLFLGRWLFIDGCINLPDFFAGSDIYLAPHRSGTFDLKPLLAMRYGCIPIVSGNGIQNDFVVDIFDDLSSGNGLKTKIDLSDSNDNFVRFYDIVLKALELHKNNPSCWNSIIRNCLKTNLSWSFERLELFNDMYSEKTGK